MIVALTISILGMILSIPLSNNIYLISLITGVMFFACGFIYPMTMGKGMTRFTNITGTASAVMYLINISITCMTSYISGFINNKNIISIIVIYLAINILCCMIYFMVISSKTTNKHE